MSAGRIPRRTNRRSRAAHADGAIRARADRSRAELDARMLDRRGARSRSHRHDRGGERGCSRRTKRRASRISRAAALRASRSRAFSASRNSGACRCNSRPRRWCRGPTPKRWSNWRWKCCAPTAAPNRRVAHRRYRHRLGRDSAGAVVRIAGRVRRRHRHQRGGAANRTAPMPSISGSPIARRSSPATMRRRCRVRST